MNLNISEFNCDTKTTDKPISLVLLLVCIYIFLVIERPWESIRYLEGLQIERFFAVAMIIAAVLVGKFKIVSSPTNKWVYGLLALHFILAPFAYNPSDSLDQGIEYAKMVVLYLIMLAVGDDEESLKILIKVYVFSMIFYCIHSLWEYHNGHSVWRMGISRMIGVDATSNDPNSFGASLILSLPFAYALLRAETIPRVKKLYYGYFCLVLLCVELTGSRSAAVALVFLLLLWALTRQGIRKYFILAITLLTFGTIWINMPAENQERIRSIWDESAGPANAHTSTDGRRLGFQAGWNMFQQAPLTGIGAGSKNFIEYRVSRLDGMSEQSHNLYAEVLSAFGLGGAVFFTGLIVSVWLCCLKVKQHYMNLSIENSFSLDLSKAIIVSVVILLVLGFAGHNFYRPQWLWLAAWSGCLFKILNQNASRLPTVGDI